MGTVAVPRHTVAGLLVEDILLAASLTGWTAVDALTSGDWPSPHAASAALAGTAALAIAWRRARPLLAFAGTVVPLCAVHAVLGPFQTGSSLVVVVVAAYSVFVHAARTWPALVMGVALAASWALDGGTLADATSNAAFVAIILAAAGAVGRTVRRQQRRGADLQARATALETESAAQERRAEEERRRIARELHDVVSHGLGVMVLHAGVAEEWLERDPARARVALEQVRASGNEAIGEMARLLSLVRDPATPERAPQPTVRDLEHLIGRWQGPGMQVRLELDGEADLVPAALQLSAYRVVQEGLTNVAKHSDASHVTVRLRRRDGFLDVEVLDDGQRQRTAPGLRTGLTGLRERVQVFGGELTAGRHPAGGWAVRASFPMQS